MKVTEFSRRSYNITSGVTKKSVKQSSFKSRKKRTGQKEVGPCRSRPWSSAAAAPYSSWRRRPVSSLSDPDLRESLMPLQRRQFGWGLRRCDEEGLWCFGSSPIHADPFTPSTATSPSFIPLFSHISRSFSWSNPSVWRLERIRIHTDRCLNAEASETQYIQYIIWFSY